MQSNPLLSLSLSPLVHRIDFRVARTIRQPPFDRSCSIALTDSAVPHRFGSRFGERERAHQASKRESQRANGPFQQVTFLFRLCTRYPTFERQAQQEELRRRLPPLERWSDGFNQHLHPPLRHCHFRPLRVSDDAEATASNTPHPPTHMSTSRKPKEVLRLLEWSRGCCRRCCPLVFASPLFTHGLPRNWKRPALWTRKTFGTGPAGSSCRPAIVGRERCGIRDERNRRRRRPRIGAADAHAAASAVDVEAKEGAGACSSFRRRRGWHRRSPQSAGHCEQQSYWHYHTAQGSPDVPSDDGDDDEPKGIKRSIFHHQEGRGWRPSPICTSTTML